jgi:SHS2 domain-containing protein
MKLPYRQLEHTADIKVEIEGHDWPQLLGNAAFCVFDLMLDSGRIRDAECREVEIASPDASELLLDWLREVLYLFSAHGYATRRVAFADVSPTHLKARLYGERFDSERHRLRLEIKSPTYHEYRVEQTPDGWRATVLFDV